MYNNVGIRTPRGSGTSGHVMSNRRCVLLCCRDVGAIVGVVCCGFVVVVLVLVSVFCRLIVDTVVVLCCDCMVMVPRDVVAILP